MTRIERKRLMGQTHWTEMELLDLHGWERDHELMWARFGIVALPVIAGLAIIPLLVIWICR